MYVFVCVCVCVCACVCERVRDREEDAGQAYMSTHIYTYISIVEARYKWNIGDKYIRNLDFYVIVT